jgi:histidinol dehydrogenase
VREIYKVGGAQAIAALAYGTETVPKVAKIFGPGNAWVTSAKTLVSSDPAGAAIDMPAGPSEVLVIADADASAEFVASDLLAQAEHGVDSQVILVTTSIALGTQVADQIEKQLEQLSRADIARGALENSRIIIVDDIPTAIEVSNRYAPEHLILQIEEPRKQLAEIRNAGSIFVGPWTPESVGDYCSGTNHVLPTYGFARTYSGLGIDQFMRQMTVQELSRDGLENLGAAVVSLAGLEGLDAHAAAVTRRLRTS